MIISIDDVVRLMDAKGSYPTEVIATGGMRLYPESMLKPRNLNESFLLLYRDGDFVEMFADSPPIVEYVHQNMKLNSEVMEVYRPVHNVDEFMRKAGEKKGISAIIYHASGVHGFPEYRQVGNIDELKQGLKELNASGREELYVFERISNAEVKTRYHQLESVLNPAMSAEAAILLERARDLKPGAKFLNVYDEKTQARIQESTQGTIIPIPQEALPGINALYSRF